MNALIVPIVPKTFNETFVGKGLGIFVLEDDTFVWKSLEKDRLKGYMAYAPEMIEANLYQLDEDGDCIAYYSETTCPEVTSYSFHPTENKDCLRPSCKFGEMATNQEFCFRTGTAIHEKWWAADYENGALQSFESMDEPMIPPPEFEIDDPDNAFGLNTDG